MGGTVEDSKEKVEYKKVNELEAGAYISKGGSLSKISESFEERPVQVELLKNIVTAFNENWLLFTGIVNNSCPAPNNPVPNKLFSPIFSSGIVAISI